MYKRELNFVFDYVTLDVMFRDFKEGEFLHCVSKYINEGIRKKVFLEVESECAVRGGGGGGRLPTLVV